MARAQSQFLTIYGESGVVYHRWQNYYSSSVEWENVIWQGVSFAANGMTDGGNGDEADIGITAPAGTLVMRAFEDAILAGHMAELRVYQFDTLADNTGPVGGQDLIGYYTGQVVGGSATLTEAKIQLGMSLSPIGEQVPPRKFTTAIMGQGCRL
jgi:hypothetical protein